MRTNPNTQLDWIDITHNNMGFISGHDYPYLSTKGDEYIIGIFGGSVANWFSLFAAQHLADSLARHRVWSGKRITVLNFSASGFKQPQQLIILSYLATIGQPIDMILNIDGFNEGVLSIVENLANNIDISLPQRYPGILKLLINGLDYEMTLWRAKLITLDRALHEAKRDDGGWSAIARLINRIRIRSLSNQLQAHLRNLPKYDSNQDLGFFTLAPNAAQSQESQLQAIVNQWIAASKAMASIASSINADYVHVFQPNQYHSNRVFSLSESKIALRPDQDYAYARGVQLIYPRMEARITEEAAQGFRILNAVAIFDTEPRQVYADTCCHYTDVGNQLLAEFIAEHAVESLNLNTTH